MGHEARVLGPCDGPPPTSYVTPLGNSIPTASNGSVAPLAPDPSCTLRTIRALRDEAFDVLHLHEPFAPGPCHTALLLDIAPAVATFHAAASRLASYEYLAPLIRRFSATIEIDVAVSADAAALVERYFPGDYEILFNGVDLERYRTIEPVKATGPTIFFCGRHEPRKGLDVLLEAMSRLPADVACWIGSDGPDTARLQAAAAGDRRLEWLGRLTERDKIARLKGATVFCAPSLGGESFGVVLLEAMAAGTPIVASALPGYVNVARSGVDAVMVPPGDPEALAAALHTILTDPAHAQHFAAAGAARVEGFSMARLAEEYVARYRRAIDLRARRLSEQSASRRWADRMMGRLAPRAPGASVRKEKR